MTPDPAGVTEALDRMGIACLVTVADMLANGEHAAGDDFTDGLEVMRVPAEWLERGTDVPVPDVGALLFG